MNSNHLTMNVSHFIANQKQRNFVTSEKVKAIDADSVIGLMSSLYAINAMGRS